MLKLDTCQIYCHLPFFMHLQIQRAMVMIEPTATRRLALMPAIASLDRPPPLSAEKTNHIFHDNSTCATV